MFMFTPISESLPTLLASSAAFVALADVQGKLLFHNFPAPPDTAPTLLSEVLPLASEQLRQMQDEVLASREPASITVGWSAPDNTLRWLLLNCSVSRSGADDVLCYLGQDISEQYLEAERLRHLEELMIDNEGIAHYGVWEWDISQPHASWTRGLYKIYGLTPEVYTPTYEAYLQLVHPDDRQRVIDATNRVFHQHVPYSHDERIFHVSGEVRYLHTWAVPVLTPDGQLKALKGVCLDITERKLAEIALAERAQELRQLNEELEQRVLQRTNELYVAKNAAEAANVSKSQFLATMSHEVRTPMNGVLGMFELLLEEHLDTSQHRMLEVVRDSAQSLLGILDDILDFSKVEAGKLELEHIPFNLRRVLEGVTDTLAANAQRKQLRLHCFVDPSLHEALVGDQVRLRQILLNLGSNAIKFTHTTAERIGEIRFNATLLSRTETAVNLSLAVSDNGIGMDEAALARLFTPYTQADASTARHYGGTGLGLSICKRFATLMGGDIVVSSMPGLGSTFCLLLQLPIAETHVEANPLLPLMHDLSVIALVHPGETQRTLAAYLTSAHVAFSSHGDWPGFSAAFAQRNRQQQTVILMGPENSEAQVASWLAQWRQAGEHPGVVLLMAREEGKALATAGIVRVWAWPLHLDSLLAGLATAAGRKPANERKAQATVLPPPDDSQLILVAEDNSVNQEIIRRQLQHLGYDCVITDNGQSALEHWRARPYGLLLTDCYMPDMDGITLTKTIRQHEQADSLPRLPIIALTANAMRGEAERCIQAGMDDYLSKPLQLATLRHLLARWLGQPGEVVVRLRE